MVFTDDTGHDDVRYAHSEAAKDRNLSSSDFVEEEERGDTGDELTDLITVSECSCTGAFQLTLTMPLSISVISYS